MLSETRDARRVRAGRCSCTPTVLRAAAHNGTAEDSAEPPSLHTAAPRPSCCATLQLERFLEGGAGRAEFTIDNPWAATDAFA